MIASIKLGVVVIPATTLLSGADLQDRLERGRVPVVYDAHEYERDRPWRWSRPRLAEEWALKERLALPSAEAVVTVSPHIAQALARDYGLEEEPAVVWNAPFRPRPLRTAEARDALEVEPNDRLVVFYEGHVFEVEFVVGDAPTAS
jgi:acyl-coenzyme A synthetase/AMP-(fatty) acid ligase